MHGPLNAQKLSIFEYSRKMWYIHSDYRLSLVKHLR
jgi:hypothetical protein